jgi:hypothetical protein
MYDLINEGGKPVENEVVNMLDEEIKEPEMVEEVIDEEVPAEEAPVVEEEEEVLEDEAPAEEEEPEVEEADEEWEVIEEIPAPEFKVQDTEEYKELLARCEALEQENSELKEFKLVAERKEKMALIESFYMLSDEDKEDVIKNVDTYSLDDIEAKLSIICVRNKVSFSLDEETDTPPTTFSLENEEFDDSITPAWVKAVQNVAKNRK